MIRGRQFLVIIFALVFSFALIHTPAHADIFDSIRGGLEGAQKSAFGDENSLASKDAQGLLGVVVSTILGLTGTIFFLIMIYGGILWMTDPGKEEQVKTAQKLIKNAIIGVLIVSLAYAATSFLGSLLFKS